MENKQGSYIYGEIKNGSVNIMYFGSMADMIEHFYYEDKSK